MEDPVLDRPDDRHGPDADCQGTGDKSVHKTGVPCVSRPVPQPDSELLKIVLNPDQLSDHCAQGQTQDDKHGAAARDGGSEGNTSRSCDCCLCGCTYIFLDRSCVLGSGGKGYLKHTLHGAGDPDKENAYSAGHAEGILLFFCKKMPDRQAGKSASRDACSVDECTNACHFQSLLSSAFLFMPFYVCLSHRVCTA